MPYSCKAGRGPADPKESAAVIKTSGDTSVGAIFVCREFPLFRRLRCFLLRRGSIPTRNQAENSSIATRDKGGQPEQTVTARGPRHRATAMTRERTESLRCQCPQGPQGAAHRRHQSPPEEPRRASPRSLDSVRWLTFFSGGTTCRADSVSLFLRAEAVFLRECSMTARCANTALKTLSSVAVIERFFASCCDDAPVFTQAYGRS
jgi:hypothetical protein